MMALGRKGGPRDTRPVDPMTGRILGPENADDTSQSNGGEKDSEAGTSTA